MKKYILGGMAIAAAAAISTVASAATYVTMGTITPAHPSAMGGNNPNVPDPALDAASAFDLRGLFSVTNGVSATSYSTQLVSDGSLSNLTAAIYTDAGAGSIGTLITTVPATFTNPNAWVFQSPVAFSLAPGSYVFQILGNKASGTVLQYQLAVTAVPLPGAALMFGAGLLVVGGLAARRKQVAAQAI